MSSDKDVEVRSANSPVQMAKLAVLLLMGKTQEEAMTELQLPRARVRRWMKDSEEFNAIYDETAAELMKGLTDKAAEQYAFGIERMTPTAMRVLEEAMALRDEDGSPTTAALNAAGKVLALRRKAPSASNVLTLEDQIRRRATSRELEGSADVISPAAGD